MLSKDVFKSKMIELKIVFPNWSLDFSDSHSMKTWYEFFKTDSEQAFTEGVQYYILNEKYTPSVAGLKHAIRQSNPYRNVRRV